MAACRAPLIAPNFMLYAVGTPALGAQGVTALGYTYGWSSDIRTFLMASIANGLKLLDDERFRGRKRRVFGLPLRLPRGVDGRLLPVSCSGWPTTWGA